MIATLSLHRFKQFKDHTFEFRPDLSLLAGGNNSGKSSVLHALAVWEFCRTALEQEKEADVFIQGQARQGFGLGDDQFSPLELPSLRHLWTNLRTQREGEPDGYTLKIRCGWKDDAGADRFLELGLSLANDRLFIKPTDSNLTGADIIPRVAYLPPFAGITAHEMRLPGAIRRRRIGEGLAGAVLRNLLLDMYQANQERRAELRDGRAKISNADLRRLRQEDPWELLQQTLRETFRAELDVADFSEEYHSYIQVDVAKGRVSGYKLTRYPNFRVRDLMVEGSGFLQWLSVYALAVNPAIDVLLLDEPDAHLHTSLQEHLLYKIQELAELSGKQVLVATHSSEILRHAKPETIFEVRSSGQGSRYLISDAQKVPLLAGLGSDYAPRVDRVRRTKRLLFVEGTSDLTILQELAKKLDKAWPEQWVEWRSSSGHKERKQVFLALKEEIPDLVVVSLRDRDDEQVESVGAGLEDTFMSRGTDDNFVCLKWRRRYIESYLIWPPAIAAASGKSVGDVEQALRDQGVAVTLGNFVAAAAPAAILDLRGKDILKEGSEAILGQLAVTAVDVAKHMDAEAIPEDIATLLDLLERRAG